jgi:hypothetical protein
MQPERQLMRCYRKSRREPGARTTDGLSATSCMCRAAVATGRIIRLSTGRARQSMIASTVGAGEAAGWRSRRRRGRRSRTTCAQSRAYRSRRSAQARAARGSANAGNRPFARRPDDQDPRHHRQHWAAVQLPSDTRQRRRRHRRGVVEIAAIRQGWQGDPCGPSEAVTDEQVNAGWRPACAPVYFN